VFYVTAFGFVGCILFFDSGVASNNDFLCASKVIIARYKKHVVFFPALSAKNDIEFQQASNKQLQSLGVHFQDLVPVRVSQGWDWLLPELTLEEWKFAQLSVFVQLTSMWPMSRTRGGGNLTILPRCFRCHEDSCATLVIQLCWNP